MQGGDVGRSLDADDQDGEIPGELIHLLAPALALHLELAEVGHKHTKKLDYDGCRDVGHHTERED